MLAKISYFHIIRTRAHIERNPKLEPRSNALIPTREPFWTGLYAVFNVTFCRVLVEGLRALEIAHINS